jgi:hypothetical protein
VRPGRTRPRGPSYWILARRGDPLEEPHLYDEDGVQPWATRDPRRLRVSFLRAGDPVDLLTSGEWQLVTVEPRGRITEVMAGDTAAECPAGWSVTSRRLDPGPVAGPQYRQIRALARKAGQVFGSSTPASLAAAGRHAEALAAIHAAPETALAWQACTAAATAALEHAGADTDWWSALPGHREYAGALIALAARDLAAPGTGGWTTEAYQLLTGPWRAAAGNGPHPADTAPAQAAGRP